MLKIRAIKIEIATQTGLCGATYEFTNGLNIIQGNNTTGKSSLFQSIIYCLGFEELLGGKNEKTMQSVFKDEVEYEGKKVGVLESNIYLEIENHEIVTIRRSVQSKTRSSKLVDVILGPYITGEKKVFDIKPMWIHDKGGASDADFGFHVFLESFLEWSLPNVYYPNRGEYAKLYMQTIAPSFIIEQKSGWSDFLNNIPIYGIRNNEARAIEFILGLDVYENEKRKQELSNRKQNLTDKWKNLFEQFKRLANKGAGELRGFSTTLPEIITDFQRIDIQIWRENQYYSLLEFSSLLQNELFELENKKNTTETSDKIKQNEKKLKDAYDTLNDNSVKYDYLSNQNNFESRRLDKYLQELKLVKEDLRKNRGALRLKQLGSEIQLDTAKNSCPTCNQPINDSLLPNEIHQIPMSLEQNISYLEAQAKMIVVYIEGQKKKLADIIKNLRYYDVQIIEARKQIRILKKELTADERLPSEAEIEKKISLKNKIKFYLDLSDELDERIENLKELVTSWGNYLKDEKMLPTNFYSNSDNEKINILENNLRQLLIDFGYESKSKEDIKISRDTYLPVIKGEFKDYNIKFDSSGSDFIRSIWAYTCSLYKTCKLTKNTFHPSLLIFDEPAQQSVSNDSFNKFLTELSIYKKGQVLVFASFNNSEDDFSSVTTGIEFNHLKTNNKMIKPINS